MTNKELEIIKNKIFEHCSDLLVGKNKEYATDIDVLANFKQPVSIMGSNQAEVCLWYDMKHIASIAKIVKDINKGELPSEDFIMEKIGDYINYGILLYANVLEIKKNQQSTPVDTVEN